MKANWTTWEQTHRLSAKGYICGYCARSVASVAGYPNHQNLDGHLYAIYICPNCGMPTLFSDEIQIPGPMLGREIADLPPDILAVYKEIQDSIKVNAYTGSILLGRKLLMHLAVDKAGASEGETFASYVEHLKNSGYIPPGGDNLLSFIQGLGNEKNHELKVGNRSEAQKILKFIETLLIFIYEFPAEVGEAQKAN